MRKKPISPNSEKESQKLELQINTPISVSDAMDQLMHRFNWNILDCVNKLHLLAAHSGNVIMNVGIFQGGERLLTIFPEKTPQWSYYINLDTNSVELERH